MKYGAYWLLVFFAALHPCQKSNMVIIDTSYNDLHVYRNAKLLLNSVGFSLIVKHIDVINNELLEQMNAVLFSINEDLLEAYGNYLKTPGKKIHPLLQKSIEVITQIAAKKNIMCIVSLPAIPGGIENKELINPLMQLLSLLGIEKEFLANNITKHFLATLLQANSIKSFRYDTSLYIPQEEKRNKLIHLTAEKFISEHGWSITALPSIRITSELLAPLFPFGLLLYAPSSKEENQFVLTANAYLQVADINENFRINPFDPSLRITLFITLQQYFYELYQIINNKKPLETFKGDLPKKLLESYQIKQRNETRIKRNDQLEKQYNWTRNGIACGWMDLRPFKNKEKIAAQHIFKTGLNMLWLELSPELYFSKHATRNEEDKKNFLESINNFIIALSEVSKELQKPSPHIFIGMNISGNFNQKKPEHAAQNIYGKHYENIPAPLDEQYWKNEIAEVFDGLYDWWKKQQSITVPISGIFLDFEMYHAQQQTSEYDARMDFSDQAWHLYQQAHKEIPLLQTNEARIDYLLTSKTLREYFSYLEQKSRAIGHMLQQHLEKQYPTLIIGAYSINPPYNWFYKGMFSGLSSPQKPLIFATFNNDFYSHYHWLTKQKIFAFHLPVILLSKLQKKEDFERIIPRLIKTHDGFWLNRYGHIEEPGVTKIGSWDFSIETTPLETNAFIEYLYHKIKNVPLLRK